LQNRDGLLPVIQPYRSVPQTDSTHTGTTLIAVRELDTSRAGIYLYLKIEAYGNTYSFQYAYDAAAWIVPEDNVDATFLSTTVAGGFVGCIYAMYATSLDNQSSNRAQFNWFEYIRVMMKYIKPVQHCRNAARYQ